MQHLPPPEDQAWLLRELSDLIHVRGAEPFLQAPIVLPTPECFPDPVDSEAALVDRITRRLMQYAGLGHLEVRLQSFAEGTIEETSTGTHCRRIAACFCGIEAGCCHFGINEELGSDPEQLAGTMAHEVAHAYRAQHELACEDADKEELLTDLTTCYLGFGLLSVNSSHRFRKWGTLTDATWSSSATGYLPPQALSFLLASQLAVRASDASQRKAIYRHLEANQAALVKAAAKAFEGHDLRRALGLGAGPPAPVATPRDVLVPLQAYVSGDEAEDGEGTPDPWNEGRPVFRIAESQLLLCSVVDTATFGLAGLALSTLLFRSWLGLLPFALGGLVRGVRRGLRTRQDVCSDAGCRAPLEPGVTRCPRCGGQVAGYVRTADERLAAEDKLAASGSQPRPRGRKASGESPAS